MDIKKYFDTYLESYKNYKENWNYEDGCVLMACKQMYEATNDDKYIQFILHYLADIVTNKGEIVNYNTEKYSIDDISCGKILFFVYEKTKEEKYKKAFEFIMKRLMSHPRCACGNFWHKEIYPNQIWLDGLYMAQPFYMEYETKYHKKENYEDIINQFRNVRKYLYNDSKKLYYHAYDEAKIQPWCNKKTGCSSNFWLRSMGWYLMALIDVIDNMSEEIYEYYRELIDLFKEAIKGILPYQDIKTGMFYQVIDQGEVEGNYLETSGTSMIAYAIMKGCRLQILEEEKYANIGIYAFEGMKKEKLVPMDGGLSLQGICHVAGLGPGEKRDGSVAYYLSEKIVSDDAKGTGPFIMAYAQYVMLKKSGGK